jgi:hypothetical protein
MILLAWEAWSFKQAWVVPTIPKLSPLTAQVLEQFRAVNPRVRPGATAVFLEDPWPGSFDMQFIAELWFRDRRTQVFLKQKWPLSEENIASADAIFTWRDEKLLRIR